MGQFGTCLHPYTLVLIYEFILQLMSENPCPSILLFISNSSFVDPEKTFQVDVRFLWLVEHFLDRDLQLLHEQLALSSGVLIPFN